MKPSHATAIWTALAVCAVVVLGAMTWLTRNVLDAERERTVAEARADLQERMRLSLWRMDSLGAAIIVTESQRTVDSYLEPVADEDDAVAMRFEFREDGELFSKADAGRVEELKRKLADSEDLRGAFRSLCVSLEAGESAWAAPEMPQMKASADPAPRASEKAQDAANLAERVNRTRYVDNVGKIPAQSQSAEPLPSGASEIGSPRARWVDGGLFLMRRVSRVPGGRVVQGAWMDAGILKDMLLAEVRDLLPEARLLAADAESGDSMVLASFPFRLDAGNVPRVSNGLRRPIVVSLAAGWCAAVFAILATALLVRGVMRLSERRASFVSAVTHELRTPLTTFRLYSDMLESGAVREEKRGDYLRVLSREADRLSHLVENVLAFSRIERGSARAVVKDTTLRDMLESVRERLEARLAAAGLEQEISGDTDRRVRVDAAAVEHILFNLIDNAAKYAAPSDPPRVTIHAGHAGSSVLLSVMDYGPGIPRAERKRIFRAFHKSARDAAETRPGVGLGLALSRRLARSLGGELTCDDPPEGGGACFTLRLPGG